LAGREGQADSSRRTRPKEPLAELLLWVAFLAGLFHIYLIIGSRRDLYPHVPPFWFEEFRQPAAWILLVDLAILRGLLWAYAIVVSGVAALLHYARRQRELAIFLALVVVGNALATLLTHAVVMKPLRM
jgi:ABC-type transporter Mla MlaB component